jgi:hypothetical protein
VGSPAPEVRVSVWLELIVGYSLTVLVEAPILLLALSPTHPLWRKWFAALWLNGCSYPIVVLVLPAWTGGWYVWVAETFAPVFECLLFAGLFPEGRNRRDMAAIVGANLASFACGELLFGVLRLGGVR